MTTLLSRAALAAAALVFSFSGAAAYTMATNGNLTVKLVVTGSCAVTSSTVTFSPQTNSSSSDQTVQVSTSIAVNCTPSNTPYSLAFGGGNNYSNGSRYMVSQTDSNSKIKYELYKDSNYQTLLDKDGFISGSGSSNTFYLQAYVAASSAVGTYIDNIVLTLSY